MIYGIKIKAKDKLKTKTQPLWHPCTQMQWQESDPPVSIESGQGVWLYEANGHRYFDAISSWWVNLFGHNNPRINAAIQAQLGKLSHTMLAGFSHPPVEMLSNLLSELAPGDLTHCFYASDGASAVEIALKMSYQYWQNVGEHEKTGFVSLRQGYHGETLGALAVTDVPIFRELYAPLLYKTVRVPTPDWRHAEAGESAEDFALRCAKELEDYLQEYGDITAAFILEPLVQGAAGMGMYHPVYLKRAREICDRYQVHLIADEIAVGFGRTGCMFACEAADIAPDLLCLSKGISAGYLPLSVVMASDKIYQAFYSPDIKRGFLHSHSYSGNALACSAALASLAIFKNDDILAANRRKQDFFNGASLDLASHPKIRHWRNSGMIWAFDVDTDDKEFAKNFARLALKRQVILRPIGTTVYFMPPYTISEDEMTFLLDATLAIMAQL